jgi:serine/threonine protein kinase/tetratricopeptide (TPR) repeat protein/TolB-like protein
MVCASCGATNPEDRQMCGQCSRSLLGPARTQPSVSGAPSRGATVPEAAGRSFETGVLSPPPEASQFGRRAIPPLSGPASAPTFEPGSSFGVRYRIESLLGQGGMGAVYKAYDIELDRTVALKLVRPELASSAETMQRFKQELLLASQISHQNILRIYDLGDSDGIKFITMAFVDGCDLSGLIEKTGRLPLDRVLNFTTQLCAALDAAHTEGVVHRDLKPQNILIDRADKLYVSDFGLAKSLAPEAATMTRTGQLLGTPRYMSPEQVEGKEVDHRSDLYSLGLILFEMFTAEVPFRGDSALQIMFQRVTAAPKDPRTLCPDLPDYLANIILKCLERDPANRYQSAGEILADLKAHNAPELSASAQTKAIQIQRTKRLRFSWIFGAGVAFAIALLFLVPRTRHWILPWRIGASKTAQVPIEHYLAILPLRIVGDEQTNRYVADGVIDELSAKLGSLKNIYVAPPNAVTGVLKKQKDPQKIAHALGVKLLLQGTVTSGSGDRIAIVITLDDVENNGRSLMQEAFTGEREDLLTLEDQIFSKVVSTLQIKESTEERARTKTRPTGDIKAYEVYMKGRNLWRESESVKDLESAIGLFDQAIKLDSQFALAYAGLADSERRIWDQTHDAAWTQKALSSARQAQALNDNLPDVHFILGSIYTTTGRTAEAIAELQRALQLAPNSDETLRRLGTAYLQAGRQQEAIAAYTQATEINPYLWTNFRSLGSAYFKLGQNEKALAAFQQITQLEPGLPDGWEDVGAVYFQMGRWSESLSKYQKAIDISPKADFYSNLATAYYYLGKFDEAAKTFEKAVSMEPENDDIRVNLGDAYRWSDQTAKATATYDEAISLAYKSIRVNPRNANALGNLAICFAKKGDSKQALKFIARARSIDPKDNYLMYEQATIYTLAGETSQAMASLEEALRNGYSIQQSRSDPDLKRLHDLPEFNRLGNQLPEKSAQ